VTQATTTATCTRGSFLDPGQSTTLQFAALVNIVNALANGTVACSTATVSGSGAGTTATVDVAVEP
jgi:hypothetical protein